MPELPEVETVVRDLRPWLVGRRFTSVWSGCLALRKPWKAAWKKRLVGRRIAALRRRGKWIVMELDDGGRLVVHLGMTGQLTIASTKEPKKAHTHLLFDLDEAGRQMRFRDVRRFGSATLFSSDEEVEASFAAAGLGPEPFGLDPAYWRRRIASTSRCVKAVLLDQSVVAGVGNIYADEALFEARLHPSRIASELGDETADRLRQAVASVLNRAIEAPGFDHPRLYWRLRVERGVPEGVPRLWLRWAAMLSLHRPDRAHPSGRTVHAFLPQVSENRLV